jgi:hypothetical protein
MSIYEPGTVAVATVRGVPNVRVFRGEGFWRTAVECGGNVTHHDFNDGVTDVRPLVVLDLTDSELGFCQDHLRAPMLTAHSGVTLYLLDKIAEQIEQQTKPPRIPEPGLWGVVEAPDGAQYVRIDTAPENHSWQLLGEPSAVDERYVHWSDIADPTLVRPGIEDGAS